MQWFRDYEAIIQFINIASDYVYDAHEELKKIIQEIYYETSCSGRNAFGVYFNGSLCSYTICFCTKIS